MNEPLLIIYGAGNKGQMLARMLNQEDKRAVHCLVDADPQKWGKNIEGYVVREPAYLRTLCRHCFKVFVAVGSRYPEVRATLTGFGLTEGVDFVPAGIAATPLADLSDDFRLLRDRIRKETLLSEERLQVLHQFACAAAHLPGDVAEVGVYRGGTSCLLATVFAQRQKRLHLYDTFAGMPPVADGIDLHRPGDFADTSLAAVESFLTGFANIMLYPGVFPASVTLECAMVGYCFVHVDADMYRSAYDSCAFFYPRLVPGGMMLFDDYGFPSCPGVKKGVDEYFADRRHKPVYLPTGQALIINNF